MRGELMDIYIMGNKVDYKIENEKTIKDIIDSIFEIVNNYGHSITEIKVDGKVFSIDDPTLQEIVIDDVDNLEIETASYFEISSALIYSLQLYIKSLKNVIEKNNLDFATFDQAKSWISDVLTTPINTLFIFSPKSEYITKRDEIVRFISSFTYNDFSNPARKQEFQNKINELEILLKDIMGVLEKISEEGNVFFDTSIDNDLSNMLRLLDDIPLKLQLGKEVEALQDIDEFSETFLELIEFLRYIISNSNSRIFSQNKETFNFSRFENITSIIEEIINSIQNKDYVSVSDLMSYELKPLVEELQKFIKDIRERALKQISEN
ncbi:MAG: hypothetical protein N2712_01480 [Brevinematales bacterium]|nr:hypothetical protein [Brevinematales bacterium]